MTYIARVNDGWEKWGENAEMLYVDRAGLA